MKILLTNPPWDGVRAGSRWPSKCRFGGYFPYPMALAGGAAALRAAGHDAILLDAVAHRMRMEHLSLYMERVKAIQPDLIIQEISTPSIEDDQYIADELACIAPLAVCGPHATAFAYRMLDDWPFAHFVLQGEIERNAVKLAESMKEGVYGFDAAKNLDEYPDMVQQDLYLYRDVPGPHRRVTYQTRASRGCPWKCLRGDTLVNTISGLVPIRELAERGGSVPVYTYSPETRRVFLADALNIRKTGVGKPLVRVHFDDGTHIDCTPDHRFLQFKWGNQFSDGRQWEVEAQHLTQGAHVRAIKTAIDKNGYRIVSWGRRDRVAEHRLVIEYTLGRPLEGGEQVHHLDGCTSNNHPDNLALCASGSDHVRQFHAAAASRRMRENNPAKNMTPEWREKLRLAVTGKTRSLEQRLRYRESKLGEKNPNYIDGKTAGRVSRVAEVNHRVVRVERLDETDDVYCMEVPATGWFFANNVAVHNCSFCVEPWQDTGKPSWRMRSPERVVAECVRAHKEFPRLDGVYLDGPTENVQDEHCRAMADGFHEHRLPWGMMTRVDRLSPDTWRYLLARGLYYVKAGMESADQGLVDSTGKCLDLARVEETVKLLKEHLPPRNIHLTCMYGIPGETQETVRKTVQFLRRLGVHWQESYFAPVPGTRYFDDAKAAGEFKVEELALAGRTAPGRPEVAEWVSACKKELVA